VITLAAVRRAMSSHRATEVREPGASLAAVALVLVEQRQGVDILLIRRAVRAGDPWSGHVALPGGRHSPADPDLAATAMRETYEETGVDLSAAERLGTLDDLHPRTPMLPPIIVRPFVRALVHAVPLVPSAEVERAFWISLDRFAEPGALRDVTLMLRGEPHVFPAYRLGGETVWGMTERILTSFLRLIK